MKRYRISFWNYLFRNYYLFAIGVFWVLTILIALMTDTRTFLVFTVPGLLTALLVVFGWFDYKKKFPN
jgi:hypothetical protein